MWAAPTCQGFLRLGEFFFYSDVFFSAVKSYFAFELFFGFGFNLNVFGAGDVFCYEKFTRWTSPIFVGGKDGAFFFLLFYSSVFPRPRP